ncbi:hypothetical protein V2J09_023101 [Rumex salicifolius]
MDDIVPVKTGKMLKPRPVVAASIPGMLGMFQIDQGYDILKLASIDFSNQLADLVGMGYTDAI